MNKNLINLLALGIVVYLLFKSKTAEAAEAKEILKPEVVKIPSKGPYTRRINGNIISTEIPSVLIPGYYLTQVVKMQ